MNNVINTPAGQAAANSRAQEIQKPDSR